MVMRKLTSNDIGREITVVFMLKEKPIYDICLVTFVDNFSPNNIEILCHGEGKLLNRIIDQDMITKIGKRIYK